MRKKTERFSTRLFVSWLIGRIEKRGKESVVNDIADYILGNFHWPQQCEGKTKKQISKMGYIYNDEWFE